MSAKNVLKNLLCSSKIWILIKGIIDMISDQPQSQVRFTTVVCLRMKEISLFFKLIIELNIL